MAIWMDNGRNGRQGGQLGQADDNAPYVLGVDIYNMYSLKGYSQVILEYVHKTSSWLRDSFFLFSTKI